MQHVRVDSQKNQFGHPVDARNDIAFRDRFDSTLGRRYTMPSGNDQGCGYALMDQASREERESGGYRSSGTSSVSGKFNLWLSRICLTLSALFLIGALCLAIYIFNTFHLWEILYPVALILLVCIFLR